jgi:ABC-type uncharacterized transport system permease subunit
LLNTRRRVLLIDKASTVLITVVGLSVILAVLGMMVFLIGSSWPLFEQEKFIPAGKTGSSGDTAAIIADDVAPVLLELPRMSAECTVSLNSLRDENAASPVPKIHQLFSIIKDNSLLESGENPWQFRQKSAVQSASKEKGLKCKAVGIDLILAQSETSLSLLKFRLGREFMTSEESRKIDSSLRNQLAAQRWLHLPDGTILLKPSKQSPSARLTVTAEEVWSLGTDLLPEKSNIENFSYIPHPNQNRGIVILTDNDLAQIFILESKENLITGESDTSLKRLPVTSKLLSKDSLDKFPPAWIQDRYIVIAMSQNSLTAIDTESEALNGVELSFPDTNFALERVTPAFGGSAMLSELSSNTKTPNSRVICAYLDVGKSIRSAMSSTLLKSPIDLLWQQDCQNAKRVLSHPTKRVAFRLLEMENSQSLRIEALELTTGRLAAQTTVPQGALETLTQDSHGDYLLWRDSIQKTEGVLQFHAPHIEVSGESLFGKIKYESYESASYSWQSTSGTDEFQPKFSLIPLIWGTFKATLYSLLFAVPLAIFAAVYSSEILDRQTRNIVKPTLEMMASVPSVVLGFLAAIVVAPWVEEHIVSVLLIGTLMPFLLYVFGVFLQVPSARHLTTRGLYASRRLLMWVIVGFAFMLWLTSRVGLFVEKTAFGGDLKAFLSGGPGTEGVLWGMLLLPLVFMSLWSLPVRRGRNWYRILVFLIGPAISIGLGGIISGHTQLRTDFFGQYAQRNTLVIALAMGFAIIPIIYSLAEDALTSVPNALRAGSLACGASVWQTTAKVVLPTAASGLFSAIMVGLGRGIGETMIAVMATGNTAVMTANPFDGLRSLAANIAVELPEAAQGSTHYRILFLSALALFMFTFTLNSLAEFLRARYRARNKAL